MNSRQKGKRGELEAAAFIRSLGVKARRGVQYRQDPDAPDILADLPLHLEVKLRQQVAIERWLKETEEQCPEKKIPIVMHRRNREQWKVTLRADTFFEMAKKVFTHDHPTSPDA